MIYRKYLYVLCDIWINSFKDKLAPKLTASFIFALILYANFIVIFDICIIIFGIDSESIYEYRRYTALIIIGLSFVINNVIAKSYDDKKKIKGLLKIFIVIHAIISIISLIVYKPLF